MSAARIWLDFLIRLPGTILHELAHYLAAKLTGSRVISFSLWPSVQNDTIQYGSVTAAYRYKVLMIPVAIAPLIWWVVLGWGLNALGIVLPVAGESRPVLKILRLALPLFVALNESNRGVLAIMPP